MFLSRLLSLKMRGHGIVCSCIHQEVCVGSICARLNVCDIFNHSAAWMVSFCRDNGDRSRQTRVAGEAILNQEQKMKNLWIPVIFLTSPDLKFPTLNHPPFYCHYYSPFSFHLNCLLFSPSIFVLFFWLSPPPLPPYVFTLLQDPLYPRDTIPSIHITSRDTDSNYLMSA